MKKTLTTILILISFFTNAQQTDFDRYKNLVKEEMQEWFTKGEFEKNKDYLERMKQTHEKLIYFKQIAIYKTIGLDYNQDKNYIAAHGEDNKGSALYFDRLIYSKKYDIENEELIFNNGIIIHCSPEVGKIAKNSPVLMQIPIKFCFIAKNIIFYRVALTSYITCFKKWGGSFGLFYFLKTNEIKTYGYNTTVNLKNINNIQDLFTIDDSYYIYTYIDENKYTPDPELTLADLNIPLSKEVKAIVYNQPKTIIPAVVTASNIQFKTLNNNNSLVGNGKSTIHFTLTNTGKGSANNLKIKITNTNNTTGLIFNKEILLGNLEANTSKDYSINVAANLQLPNSTANFKFEFEEDNGFYPDPIEISFPTLAFVAPKLQIVDYSFLSNTGKLEKAKPIVLKALLQNLGQGIANNISIQFVYPNNHVFNTSSTTINIDKLQPNETKELTFEFITNKNYTEKNIPITIKIQEEYKQFAEDRNVVANFSDVVNTAVAVVANNDNKTATTITPASLFSDVDKNIPINTIKNPYKFALIIGNEDYSSRQSSLQKESNVPFAINDAKTFKEYCVQSLGIEEENVFLLFNATAGEMNSKIELVTEIIKRLGNKAELMVYYAGHGFPDDKTKTAYLVPVDVSVSNLSSAIKLNDMYQKLSKTNAQKITVFLDACFTGGGREESLVAGARGIKIVPNEDVLTGNLLVFSATTNDQSALPYKEKQHGIFTYYILKALQNSSGKITFLDLEKYVKENVSIQSLKVNAKAQDPQIKYSEAIKNTYLNWNF